MSANQLAALVERAKAKAPPVISPAPPPPRRKESRYLPKPPKPEPVEQPTRPAPATPLPQPPESPATSVAAATPDDDFPTGWQLSKESWHFHRRFHAIFRRPMHRGEYSHLLWQIRRSTAEHLVDDCWRVTLPNGRTLPVRGNVWKLITILPKHWQPPPVTEPT